jgi:hypothetical protein
MCLNCTGQVCTIEVCAPLGNVYNTIATQLHLDVSGQQEPLLLLDVSTLQSHEKHLKVPRQQKPVLLVILTDVPIHPGA